MSAIRQDVEYSPPAWTRALPPPAEDATAASAIPAIRQGSRIAGSGCGRSRHPTSAPRSSMSAIRQDVGYSGRQGWRPSRHPTSAPRSSMSAIRQDVGYSGRQGWRPSRHPTSAPRSSMSAIRQDVGYSGRQGWRPSRHPTSAPRSSMSAIRQDVESPTKGPPSPSAPYWGRREPSLRRRPRGRSAPRAHPGSRRGA